MEANLARMLKTRWKQLNVAAAADEDERSERIDARAWQTATVMFFGYFLASYGVAVIFLPALLERGTILALLGGLILGGLAIWGVTFEFARQRVGGLAFSRDSSLRDALVLACLVPIIVAAWCLIFWLVFDWAVSTLLFVLLAHTVGAFLVLAVAAWRHRATRSDQ